MSQNIERKVEKAEEEAKRLFYCFVCCSFAESNFSTLAKVDKMVKNCNLKKLEWTNGAIDYWKNFATWASSGNFSSPIFENKLKEEKFPFNGINFFFEICKLQFFPNQLLPE